jgi:hypothetical protein
MDPHEPMRCVSILLSTGDFSLLIDLLQQLAGEQKTPKYIIGYAYILITCYLYICISIVRQSKYTNFYIFVHTCVFIFVEIHMYVYANICI